jgi:hypothetical protein
MRLQLKRILDSYVKASQELFECHPIAETMRDAKQALAALIPDAERYVITFSRGNGRFAEIPWLGIRRPEMAKTFQSGVYAIYLFHRDMERVYLALALGVSQFRHGEVIEDEVERLRARLDIPSAFNSRSVDLNARNKLGQSYERACICARRYDAKDIPEDEELRSDLLQILKVYDGLKPSDVFRSLAPL